MENNVIKITRNTFKNKIIYVGLFIAFVVMMFFFPNEGRFKYDYQKGRPWVYETLVAPIDFPILKSQTELLAEKEMAASKVIPYYVHDNNVLPVQLQKLKNNQMLAVVDAQIGEVLVNSFNYVYDKGVMPDKTATADQAEEHVADNSSYIMVQKNRRAVEVPESELFTKSSAVKFIRSELIDANPLVDADSIIWIVGLKDLVLPNLAYDAATTKLLHKEAVNYISPTKGMIYTGQLIVSEGETVTAEIEQMLDSYKAEYELSLGYTEGSWKLLLGHTIFVLVILALIYVTVYFVDIDMFKRTNQFAFILFLVVLAFVITVVVRNISSEYLYFVPYAVFALYMMAFFHAKLIFPIYMILLLPLLILADHGTELYMLNVFAGGVALVSFSYLNRGWLQFMNSLLIFIGMMLVHVAFEIVEAGSLSSLSYKEIMYIFFNALFVVATYPLVFLLEKIFVLVSVSTLKDLSDTNNALLQELARKAPGTFQHSLQVANLAERAVAAIGGNARLVKVGAMYHDVGKLNNPQCFIENAAPGINYHAGLSPMESAHEIIRHVDNGVELAKKYHLPKVIIEFITSHHGQSQTGYFYNIYCNSGGDPANIGEFTYKGTLPTSKEQVVVMMADAVEAASRSLKDYSIESISKLVDGILSQRMSDSQLVRADISIKEINIVKSIFKRHLGEIYHARIAYPARKAQ
ncbi:MAG: HDIG domain-containing protein [Bacteroidales bacterium]|nr:HDIG domain-containing protein [Bacteroidales bacterium]